MVIITESDETDDNNDNDDADDTDDTDTVSLWSCETNCYLKKNNFELRNQKSETQNDVIFEYVLIIQYRHNITWDLAQQYRIIFEINI